MQKKVESDTAVAADKREKFVELAERRTQAAIDKISLIGNLANKGAYDWADSDLKKIVNVLEDAVDRVKNKFLAASSGKRSDTFKL